uniref:Uncharacterized protein n=1 Tax=Branchiostoma floridae TaxID=7739 RepID=C3Y3P0_BRAFL|eukprot:XP_002608906.1 hypothetical protein BRAFLDRAFT_85529 [Branchiostoma floridae]
MAGELLSLGSNDYKQNMVAVGGLQQGLNSLMGSARSTPSEDQTEEQAEHAKKATNAVTSATTTLGTVVLNHRLPGEPSVGFQYDNFGVAFQKRYSESVGSEGFTASEGSVSLPSSDATMKSSDEALNTKFMNFNENPFDWDNTSKIVTKVVSLDLTSETGGAFPVKDTANDISIFVGNDADPPEPRLVSRNISEPGKSEMLYHEITVPYNSCAIFTAFVPYNRTEEEVGLETVSSNVPKDDDESRVEESELKAPTAHIEELDSENGNEPNEMDNSKEEEDEEEKKEEKKEEKMKEKKEKKDEFIFPHWCK